MTADPIANPGPSPRSPQPGEQFFQQSIADLARRLGERADQPSADGAQTAAEARRRAMQAFEQERARRMRLMLGGVAAFIVTAGIAGFVVFLGQSDEEATVVSRPVSAIQAAAAPTVASAEPAAPAQPPAQPPAQSSEQSPPPAAATKNPPSAPVQAPLSPSVQAASVASSDPPPPPMADPSPATPSPLSRGEIREVQKRLRGFGFDPGPLDGVAGRQTEIATQHYLEARSQAQLPPSDPQLLDQLRRDSTSPPAPPQVAQRTGRSGNRTAQAAQPARRQFDPFQPVKVAGSQITQWLQSAFR